ncbi:hypothetical protein YPC_3523 [Yersinia pestis biovar Medievalis str. Harbin 35]|nr:hypothetical protein YPC_3523 [Yersinia pestis biovar Medievalis str. Harbin 35]
MHGVNNTHLPESLVCVSSSGLSCNGNYFGY